MNTIFTVATLGAVVAAINLSESYAAPDDELDGTPLIVRPTTVEATVYEVYSELCNQVAYTTEPGMPEPIAFYGVVHVETPYLPRSFFPEYDCDHYD